GPGAAVPPQLRLGVYRGADHDLFLVAEHQGDRGVKRQGAEGDEDHDGDGRDPADLGDSYSVDAGRVSSSTADSGKSALLARCDGFSKELQLHAEHGAVRHIDGVWALGAGDERRGVAGAGESRDRT